VIDIQEANRRHKRFMTFLAQYSNLLRCICLIGFCVFRYGKAGCYYFYDVGTHMRLMNDLMGSQENYVIDATKYGNVSRFLNHR